VSAAFDRQIAQWREDNYSLRSALGLPPEEVWSAHLIAKHELLEAVREKTGLGLDEEVFTIGFARRATGYKRADLILSDLDRLRQIAKSADNSKLSMPAKRIRTTGAARTSSAAFFTRKRLCAKPFLLFSSTSTNLDLGGKITSGVDLWLNTPQFPLEASGTSGMKAALNGVPSLSILDGWWVEGHIEGVTGWSIGEPRRSMDSTDIATDNAKEAESLYSKLENVILPMFYKDPHLYIQVMQHAIAINGSFFNTQRMVQHTSPTLICGKRRHLGKSASEETGSNLQLRIPIVQQVSEFACRRAALSPYPKYSASQNNQKSSRSVLLLQARHHSVY